MKFLKTEIPEVIVVEPDVYRDARGFFLESYHSGKYREGGIAAEFVQDNHSSSRRGTLRGLHAQRTDAQGKLVRAVQGAIWDVAVDVRLGSPTFARWVALELSAESFRQVWVPPGFLHGFCVLTDTAQVEYKVTAFYQAADELGVAWDDPEIAVAWPVRDPLLSKKDAALPRLEEVRHLLPRYAG